MAVAVVQVGIVRVLVPQRFVAMPVRVRLAYGTIVLVLMMLVMDVAVLVLQRFMLVPMGVPLGQMEP